jgi:uncharacterized protein YukE
VSIQGMDVDQLRGLAAQLDSDAQTLYRLVTTMNGVTAQMVLLWHGSAAATFETDWQSKNRPALLAAYNTLTSLHAHLVGNINQQASASAANDGLLETVKADVGTVWGDAQRVSEWTGPIGAVSGFIPGTDDLPVFGALGAFGTAMTYATLGVEGYDAGEAVGNHQYAAAGGDLVDATATELKSVDPAEDPELYLAGVDLALLKEDYDLAGQIDWREGVPCPWTGDNFREIYAPVFESLPGEMVGPLREAFF